MTSPAASPASTVHSTARDGAVHIFNKEGWIMQELGIVKDWPEPEGSYYSRPWRGYVEAFGFKYGFYEPQWVRVARISSVEEGQAYVAENIYDTGYRIVDVGGNVYEEGVANASPAS